MQTENYIQTELMEYTENSLNIFIFNSYYTNIY